MLSTFTVTSTADDGSNGTLRWAIAQANDDNGASTIDFNLGTSPATITLTQEELDLRRTSGSIAIDGPGASLLTIDGNQLSRDFAVEQGVTASFSGLTITGASAGFRVGGGGLYNAGTTTLYGCTISGNSAYYGGGVYNKQGSMTLTDCTISGNTANQSGGVQAGTYFSPGGTMVFTNCTIDDNTFTNLGPAGLVLGEHGGPLRLHDQREHRDRAGYRVEGHDHPDRLDDQRQPRERYVQRQHRDFDRLHDQRQLRQRTGELRQVDAHRLYDQRQHRGYRRRGVR